MREAAAGIAVESASKHYPTPGGIVRALDGITLEVEPGSSLAITGPSGCGKSTLIALMGGLETPTAGRVAVDGREVGTLSDDERAGLRREAVGLVFQADNLMPFLTVVENVALQLSLRGARDGYERCLTVLEELGLGDQTHKLPDQLSGGQRQRVAVARSVIHQPRVILADEPTGALDADASDAVVGVLLAAQEETSATLVVVTHDLAVAERMERRVLLRDGKLVNEQARSEETARGEIRA
jgi:putative ABC transport system ATP-binding protein